MRKFPMVVAVVSMCNLAVVNSAPGPVILDAQCGFGPARRPAPPGRGQHEAIERSPAPDPVVARVLQHDAPSTHRLVRVVGADDFPKPLWERVNNLVAFRIHRHAPDGTTTPDAAIYLVWASDLYFKGEAALRTGTTNHEYVWCLLAAVLAHEGAHTGPMTERRALTAEAEQLRRCLFAGHLYSADGWSAGAYLGQVQAKLRKPREHY